MNTILSGAKMPIDMELNGEKASLVNKKINKNV